MHKRMTEQRRQRKNHPDFDGERKWGQWECAHTQRTYKSNWMQCGFNESPSKQWQQCPRRKFKIFENYVLLSTHHWSNCRWFFAVYIDHRQCLVIWCVDPWHVVLHLAVSTESEQNKINWISKLHSVRIVCYMNGVCECISFSWSHQPNLVSRQLHNKNESFATCRATERMAHANGKMKTHSSDGKLQIHSPQMLRWEPTQLQWQEVLSVCPSNFAGSDLPTPTVMNMQKEDLVSRECDRRYVHTI